MDQAVQDRGSRVHVQRAVDRDRLPARQREDAHADVQVRWVPRLRAEYVSDGEA